MKIQKSKFGVAIIVALILTLVALVVNEYHVYIWYPYTLSNSQKELSVITLGNWYKYWTNEPDRFELKSEGFKSSSYKYIYATGGLAARFYYLVDKTTGKEIRSFDELLALINNKLETKEQAFIYAMLKNSFSHQPSYGPFTQYVRESNGAFTVGHVENLFFGCGYHENRLAVTSFNSDGTNFKHTAYGVEFGLGKRYCGD